ncbi:MAG: 4Fe-4S dicluster domain-containing protein [Candidatus Hodarchaeales archaeon]
MMNRTAKPMFNRMYRAEQSLTEKEGVILSIDSSPVRFEIPLEMVKMVNSGGHLSAMTRKTAPIMIGNVRDIQRSIKSVDKNPEQPRNLVDDHLLEEMVNFARDLGVGVMGYTKLPRELIFRDKAVMFDNAIVLAMEMDSEKIALAPSEETGIMIFNTYKNLGVAAIKLADFLREKGFSAHPVHPLGGVVLFPPLAKLAGLGWYGKHGLLITPEFGPRVRLAAVFTSIENLPSSSQDSSQAWIVDYCTNCRACVKKCPTGTILEAPIVNDNGIITHTDNEKCFPFFTSNHGCTICIKVCPFSKKD